ncbi:FAS1 domain-containing protein [Russula earlei]|uniref:FAS1 domain-containing protein n=1 Tax=Russula earlei TaxID=71964 RepID=A0ACC0UQE3_9AGAM|nr:FAS1 domain-containing protein [Russula earlei]
MLLFHLIPLSLLALLPYSLADPSEQYIFLPSQDTLSTTLVDKLSEDPDYTTLLRLLQRARLIPTLNRLDGATLFAPTNDAIHRHASLSRFSSLTGDNVNEQLRQELFYHLLNYTVALPNDNDILVTKTLHFPHGYPGPPSEDPPPSPPWLPIPGGSLGGEPQRLRVGSRNGHINVGVDAFGKGGARVIKAPVDAGNGLLVGIDGVLPVPPSLSSVVSTYPSTSYFHRILDSAVISRLNETAELTIFVPVDSAWNALHPIEKLYLESEFATDDLIRIFEMHAVVHRGVKWSESFKPAINLTTLNGRQINIVTTSDKVIISDAELIQPDLYASNGVMHTISSLLIPEGTLQLTPEKFLLTLNCTNFISMIHSVNLNRFINDTHAKYTILAPQDDVISAYGNEDLPEKGSDDLKRLLKYHFLPGRWTPKTLKDGLLIETALDEPGLAGKLQVLEASISHTLESQAPDVPSISFAGASTIGDPIEVNNTVIYFISRPLFPPVDSLQVALPMLNFSSFLAAIFSADLADIIKTNPRTTLLVPHNDAFKRLGQLVSAHLLASSSKADLKSVILHHVIDGVVYTGDLRNSTARTYPTLEGSDLHVEHTKGHSISLTPSGGWPGLRSELTPMNLLSSTGVVHELSDIFIPRSVHLTVGKLAKAAKGTTMTNLIIKAGMEWVLNGTTPPADSPWGQSGISGTGWTLLCPSDDAFKKVNLTRLHSDKTAMQLIVGQHLLDTRKSAEFSEIPNNQPVRFDDLGTYETLISPESTHGDIIFRGTETGEIVVGIKNAPGTGGKMDWAKVTAWGRATTGGGTGGVVQIDRLLVPYEPPLFVKYGFPAVVAVFGVLAICLFFMGVRKIWRLDRTEATYEPIGGFGREDDN